MVDSVSANAVNLPGGSYINLKIFPQFESLNKNIKIL